MHKHVVIGYQYTSPPFSGYSSETDVRLVLDEESLDDYCELVSISIAYHLTGDPQVLSELEGKFIHLVPAWGFDGWDLFKDFQSPSVDIVEFWGYPSEMHDPGDNPEDFQWLITPMNFSYEMLPLSYSMPVLDDFEDWFGNSIIPEFACSFMTTLQGKDPILPASYGEEFPYIGFYVNRIPSGFKDSSIKIVDACMFDPAAVGGVAPTPEQVKQAILQAGTEIVTRKRLWELVNELKEFEPESSICKKLAANDPDPLNGYVGDQYKGAYYQVYEGFEGDRGFFEDDPRSYYERDYETERDDFIDYW